MTIRHEFIKREIIGESFLVPIGEAAKAYNGLFALTEVGAFLWDRLPEAKNEQQLVELLLEEYDVTREEASEDTRLFLEKLRKMDII